MGAERAAASRDGAKAHGPYFLNPAVESAIPPRLRNGPALSIVNKALAAWRPSGGLEETQKELAGWFQRSTRQISRVERELVVAGLLDRRPHPCGIGRVLVPTRRLLDLASGLASAPMHLVPRDASTGRPCPVYQTPMSGTYRTPVSGAPSLNEVVKEPPEKARYRARAGGGSPSDPGAPEAREPAPLVGPAKVDDSVGASDPERAASELYDRWIAARGVAEGSRGRVVPVLARLYSDLRTALPGSARPEELLRELLVELWHKASEGRSQPALFLTFVTKELETRVQQIVAVLHDRAAYRRGTR